MRKQPNEVAPVQGVAVEEQILERMEENTEINDIFAGVTGTSHGEIL